MPLEVWLPLLTFVLGFGSSLAAEWLRDARVTRRERVARQEMGMLQQAERRAEFQRETLLNLQEALDSYVRSAFRAWHHDIMARRSGEPWHETPLPSELDEALREANVRTMILAARVEDERLRELVKEIKTTCDMMMLHGAPEHVEEISRTASRLHDESNERVGVILRGLY
jgi:hypothetical protein